MKNSKQLRTWLVDEAARKRMSQAEMARRTDKSAATYSRILDGTTKELNQKTVDAICSWAGINQIALLEIAIGQTPSSRGGTPKGTSAATQKLLNLSEDLDAADRCKLLEFAQLLRDARK